MILALLIIAVVMIVAAFRNTQGALFSALYQDVPDFVVWAAAIFAVGAIGFVPGLKPVSRGILALLLLSIVLSNYKQIIAGFNNAWQHPPAAGPGVTPPADNYVSPGLAQATSGPLGINLNPSNIGDIATSAVNIAALAGGV